jgi:CDP-diacylglycerol--glycerol-3-phosphate 3-phosphatidyltransferase
MAIYQLKPRFQVLLAPVGRFCVQRKISPALLNLAGFLFSLGIGVVILNSLRLPLLALLIPPLALLRLAANALDGMVARQQQKASARGALLNEMGDRFSDVVIFGSFLLLPDLPALLPALIVILTLLASFLAVACRAAGGSRLRGGLADKADRLVWLSLAALFVPRLGLLAWQALLWLLLPLLVLTLCQRWLAAWRELGAL